MPPEMIWNSILTLGIGIGGWFLNTLYSEISRLQILLNRTREEIAKDYATKADLHSDINRVLSRLDLMEKKIDRLIEKGMK
jgi:hypothetical protein